MYETQCRQQRRNFVLAKLASCSSCCWCQCSVRTSDLGWTPFSLTWIPGSLGDGEPEHAAAVHPCMSSGRPFTFCTFFNLLTLCTEVVRSRPVVTPSAGTGRSPPVQPCLSCCWLLVELLALASPPEPLNWLFSFPAVAHAFNASGLFL